MIPFLHSSTTGYSYVVYSLHLMGGGESQYMSSFEIFSRKLLDKQESYYTYLKEVRSLPIYTIFQFHRVSTLERLVLELHHRTSWLSWILALPTYGSLLLIVILQPVVSTIPPLEATFLVN